MDPDQRLVVDHELALLDPAVRTSGRAAELLDPEFFEFGASGRRWDRASVLAMMVAEPADGPRAAADEIATTRLGDDLILVTYRSTSPTRTALRSSLWRRTDGSWRVYFHQGTPV